ncbi:hypothetical protein [Photobacterium sanguinicancri]|uniref:hypothetical protein n=1 Tax=Photobacterium sanguinicancri TaxID=875932 RepID=UPI0026E41056|nr:hypothetical protein [Photobacterium sanguinicancri]MDO6498445.1 hypothetical protein [Photobacterium sanguinicancri]
MIRKKVFSHAFFAAVIASSLLLVGCSQGPAVIGSEAVLVPMTAELQLAAKTQKKADQEKIYLRAHDFIVQQFEQHAEKIVVTANTTVGKRIQGKLKRNLGKYQQWIDYKFEHKPHSDEDLFIIANRTEVIIPPCEALGQYNIWDQQDGCFTERARSKQLATPSTLMPVESEMTIEQRESQ